MKSRKARKAAAVEALGPVKRVVLGAAQDPVQRLGDDSRLSTQRTARRRLDRLAVHQ
jgi:hypothetical protein